MTTPLVRRRDLRVGPLRLSVAVEERTAQRVRDSALGRVLRRRSLTPSPGTGMGAAGTGVPARPEQAIPHTNGTHSNGTHTGNDVQARVNELEWYHVMELPGGVVTPGRADHRAELALYGIPDDMHGLRALDVATFDGYWAFEMERRGADVTAIDIPSWSHIDLPLRWREGMKPEQDAPTGDGFRLAAGLLGSKVTRREQSVYDLSPDEVGRFDVVFISDLLQHLRDPQRALERVYSVTKPGGYLLLAENYAHDLEKFSDVALMEFRSYRAYTWWMPTTAALKLMLRVAGYDVIEEVSRIGLNFDEKYSSRKVILRARRSA
jgi:tRNA (mo5U34)-methyltransferase